MVNTLRKETEKRAKHRLERERPGSEALRESSSPPGEGKNDNVVRGGRGGVLESIRQSRESDEKKGKIQRNRRVPSQKNFQRKEGEKSSDQ